MTSNSDSYGGHGLPVAVVNLDEEMAAFDHLPVFLRDRLNYAPQKGLAKSLLELYEAKRAEGVPDWVLARQIDLTIRYFADRMLAIDDAERATIRIRLNGPKRPTQRRRVDPKLALQRAEDRQRRVQAAA